MSGSNGHLPPGAKKLTLDIIRAKSRKWVKMMRQSEEAGEDVYVCIRAIRQVDYMMLQPPPPPGSDRWPTAKDDDSAEVKAKIIEERGEKARAWYDALPESERWARSKTALDVHVKVCLLGVVDPVLDEDSVRDLGDDIDFLANEILIFSGVIKRIEEPKEVPA